MMALIMNMDCIGTGVLTDVDGNQPTTEEATDGRSETGVDTGKDALGSVGTVPRSNVIGKADGGGDDETGVEALEEFKGEDGSFPTRLITGTTA